MREAAIIAEHLPGLGDPLELPIDDFNGYLMEIVQKFENKNAAAGNVDHRAYVEAQMRKAQRG